MGSPLWGWFAVGLTGVAAPVAAALLLHTAHSSAALALGLMGTGMIAAATYGRLWVGVLLALVIGAGLILLARWGGASPVANPLAAFFALVVASVSFAARGALFARSAEEWGWLIALFVVAGEAAMLITALLAPGALPDWLLALLPAQWANVAILTAFTGAGPTVTSSVILALGGTAATTLLVAALWPRRWPYAIMFTAWLALSALVMHRPGPIFPAGETTTAAATAPSANR